MSSSTNDRKLILFVDDEQRILDGLKRTLRKQSGEWEMLFVTSGEEALRALTDHPVNVIVSDMRMPGMDGATLLGRVHAEHPRVVRIVLSGHSETESSLRAAAIAHQFLSKPCDADQLRDIVSRACRLDELLAGSRLAERLGTIRSLPPTPRIYNQLVAAMSDPDVGIADATEIVEQDAAIATKVLQLVNSSFFSIARSIVDLREATTYLGLTMLRDLTLSMEVFRAFDVDSLPRGFSLDKEQEHSLSVAALARDLMSDKREKEEAFLAGMLHDVGKLVLATSDPESLGRAISATPDGAPLHLAELEQEGVTHAEVGGYVLGLWGMPYSVIEAVANHHQPERVPEPRFGPLCAVHVADALVHEFHGGGEAASDARLDPAYLAQVGVSDRLEEWRALARENAAGGGRSAA